MPTFWPIILTVVAIGALVGLVYSWHSRRESSRRMREIAKRAPSDPREWHRRYFKPLGLEFGPTVTVAKTLAKHFGCDPTCFRPDDRFDRDLRIRGLSLLALGGQQDREVSASGSEKREPSEEDPGDCRTFAMLVLWCQDPSQIRPARCPNCGYDLRGSTQGRCSECGTRFAETPVDEDG